MLQGLVLILHIGNVVLWFLSWRQADQSGMSFYTWWKFASCDLLYVKNSTLHHWMRNILYQLSQYIVSPGAWITKNSYLIPMLISMLFNTDFQTWHLIGWKHSCQPIRSHVRNPCWIKWNLSQILICNPGPRTWYLWLNFIIFLPFLTVNFNCLLHLMFFMLQWYKMKKTHGT